MNASSEFIRGYTEIIILSNLYKKMIIYIIYPIQLIKLEMDI